ncbi:MAG: hypothetical protein WDW36_002025 [Sanguina aurantia]
MQAQDLPAAAPGAVCAEAQPVLCKEALGAFSSAVEVSLRVAQAAAGSHRSSAHLRATLLSAGPPGL